MTKASDQHLDDIARELGLTFHQATQGAVVRLQNADHIQATEMVLQAYNMALFSFVVQIAKDESPETLNSVIMIVLEAIGEGQAQALFQYINRDQSQTQAPADATH